MKVSSWLVGPAYAMPLGPTHIVNNEGNESLCGFVIMAWNQVRPRDLDLITCKECLTEFAAIALQNEGIDPSMWEL